MENTFWFAVKPVELSNCVYIIPGDCKKSVEGLADDMYHNPVITQLTWKFWQAISGCMIPAWNEPDDLVRGDLNLPQFQSYRIMIKVS